MKDLIAIQPEKARYLINLYALGIGHHQPSFKLAMAVRVNFAADPGYTLDSCEPSLFLWPCLGSPWRK